MEKLEIYHNNDDSSNTLNSQHTSPNKCAHIELQVSMPAISHWFCKSTTGNKPWIFIIAEWINTSWQTHTVYESNYEITKLWFCGTTAWMALTNIILSGRMRTQAHITYTHLHDCVLEMAK